MSTIAPSRSFALPATPPTPRGAAFAKAAMMIGLTGSAGAAVRTAESRYGADNSATRLLKAAVAPGSSSDTTWAGLLTDPGAREVFAAIRERSIIGRLPGMRRVPPNVHIVLQTGNAAASWVKENTPKPLTRIDYANGPQLKILKLQATVVATRELLSLSTPAAEDLFREELLRAVTAEQDNSFINPLNGGIPDQKPASITNPVTPITSAGSPDSDIEALFAAYAGDWETAAIICNGKVGASLAGVTRPGAGANGGQISGVPLICSRNCPDNILVMVDAAGLIYFEEGAGMDRSEHSTIEMNDAPAGGASAVPVSLWQANMVALRIELFTNWARARTDAVAYVTGITWA